MAIPNELLLRCADGQDLQNALECLKNSHPGVPPKKGPYDHIHVRMLMRKMLPRLYTLPPPLPKACVPGARVFWRPGATSDLDFAVFFFVRLRPKNPNAYFMSVGVGTSVDSQTIVDNLNELANYVKGQSGDLPLILLAKIIVPTVPPPQLEEPPVTGRPNLNAAFDIARNGNPQLLFYQGTTTPDSPPWPDSMHWWKIQPHTPIP